MKQKRAEISSIGEVLAGIRNYAKAYAEFEALQASYAPGSDAPFLQKGDQKTGVIGEFYSLIYATTAHANCEVALAPHPSSDTGDIVVKSINGLKHIQVKTVSGFSQGRRTSKIEFTKLEPFDHEVYVISLDCRLMPDGFWILRDLCAKDRETLSRGVAVPKDGCGGSKLECGWAPDRIDELLETLGLTALRHNVDEMLCAVSEFHFKNGFEVGTENRNTMYYRMNLMAEEMGEICQALTKGLDKSKIAEEHADLFILLLGNCLTMNIDLVDEFWKKMRALNAREGRRVGDHLRVSAWSET